MESELKAKLATKNTDIGHIKKTLARMEQEKEDIELTLKDAQKPKLELKLGDYGMAEVTSCSPEPRLAVDDGPGRTGDLHTVGLDGKRVDSDWTGPGVRYGNIFDDLKAMQEDVTEFEIASPTESYRTLKVDSREGKHVYACMSIYIHGNHKDCFNLSEESLSVLISNLISLRATKRKASK